MKWGQHMWTRVAAFAIGGLGLMGCATFEVGAPAGRVDIIAHRGASAYAPENTLAAFEKAIALKADWFELDCTLTKDNEVVVIHDDTLARTTSGVPGEVQDFTLAELKRYDVGSWFDSKFASERFPSLGESLDLAKGKIGVYIEVKNSDDDSNLTRGILADFNDAPRLFPEHRDEILKRIESSGSRNLALTRRVIALVRAQKMEKQIVIQSFSPIVCAVALIEAPDLRTELLASSSERDPLQWNRYLQWLRLLSPHGFNANNKDLTETLIHDLHAQGKTVAVWTVNDPAEMVRLTRWGVDALITDKPDVAMETTR
jgi:glycerophosphoryl diester phosphodiesterase